MLKRADESWTSTFAGRASPTAFEAEQILVVPVSPQQSQRPSDRIFVFLVQDQLRVGDLDLAQTDLFALVVDVDHFEELVVWQENATIVDSFKDVLRVSTAHGDECGVGSGRR